MENPNNTNRQKETSTNEITKARSRVTANTPAFNSRTPPFNGTYPHQAHFSEVKPEMQLRDDAERSAIATPSIDKHVITNNTPTLNVLIQMKNDNKNDYTINFTRKASIRSLAR